MRRTLTSRFPKIIPVKLVAVQEAEAAETVADGGIRSRSERFVNHVCSVTRLGFILAYDLKKISMTQLQRGDNDNKQKQ